MSLKFIHLPVLMSIMLGCTTTTTTQRDRDGHLQQFLGQTTQHIRQNLDLKQLGYYDVSEVMVRDHQLIYRIQRPVTIPTPTAIGIGAVPLPLDSSSKYDISITCEIIYHIQNNIAQSVSYTGRTC